MGKASQRRKRQKERKVFEHQVQPALEAAEAAYKKYKTLERVIDPYRLAKTEKVYRLQGKLLDPKEKKQASAIIKQLKADTAASRPPTGYYVIVGRGPAAVINHTTLRQSQAGRERLGGTPVLHVGFEDPWLHYHEHGMGQPPFLLRMPGYHEPVPHDAKTIRSGLSSRVFAASTHAEMTHLRENFPVYVVEGWVATIESRGARCTTEQQLVDLGLSAGKLHNMLQKDFKDGYPPYRLLVVTPEAELYFVYAASIDICSGGGRARVLPRELGPGLPPLLAGALAEPWIPSYRWKTPTKKRKVVHGMDGLTEATEWAEGQRVCVYGAGGIGLNQIERAHDEESVYLDWFAREYLHDPTLNLRRNDTVFKTANEDADSDFMEPGEADACRTTPTTFDTGFRLIPGSAKWRWAHFAKVKELAEEEGKLIIRLFKQGEKGATAPVAVDYFEKQVALDDERYFPVSQEYQDEHGEDVCSDAQDGKPSAARRQKHP